MHGRPWSTLAAMMKLALGLLSLAASLFLSTQSCCGVDAPPIHWPPIVIPTIKPAEVKVTLLHFSDYHSHAVPYFSEHAADQGGIARTMAYVQRRKAELPNVLLLNGGD